LFDDPYAAAFVAAAGPPGVGEHPDDTEAASPQRQALAFQVIVRTRYYDDYLKSAVADGCRQVVLLAAGLDTRAFRLPWPAGTTVFEADLPDLLAVKERVLADAGAQPQSERVVVAVDLREDWLTALTGAGFDASRPTAWLAEGLLVYLPPEAQDRLFDNIAALSAPGSRLATEFHPDAGASIGERAAALRSEWQEHGFDVNLADLFYPGERNNVVDYLAEHGWTVSAQPRPELFKDYGKEFPDTDELAPLRNSLAVIATRK